MRLQALILASGLLATPAAAQRSNTEINAELVTRIEAQMVMPRDAAPVGEYYRFYVITEALGRSIVSGVYLRTFGLYYSQVATPIDGVAGAYRMRSGDGLPVVYDGGCAVVSVAFDLDLQTLWAPGKVGEDALSKNSLEPTGICNGLA